MTVLTAPVLKADLLNIQNQGKQLLTMRAEGDKIRLRIPEDGLLLTPFEAWRVADGILAMLRCLPAPEDAQ